MPETISHHVKLDMLTLVAAGYTGDHAVHLMYISKSTIAHAKRKQKLYGDHRVGSKCQFSLRFGGVEQTSVLSSGQVFLQAA